MRLEMQAVGSATWATVPFNLKHKSFGRFTSWCRNRCCYWIGRVLTERNSAVWINERASRRGWVEGVQNLSIHFFCSDPMDCEVSLLKHHLQTIDLSTINWKQTPGRPITWCSDGQHNKPSRFHPSNPLRSLIALSWHIEQDFFCQQHERVGFESISKCFDTCCKCNWPFLNRLWSICWTLQLPI